MIAARMRFSSITRMASDFAFMPAFCARSRNCAMRHNGRLTRQRLQRRGHDRRGVALPAAAIYFVLKRCMPVGLTAGAIEIGTGVPVAAMTVAPPAESRERRLHD